MRYEITVWANNSEAKMIETNRRKAIKSAKIIAEGALSRTEGARAKWQVVPAREPNRSLAEDITRISRMTTAQQTRERANAEECWQDIHGHTVYAGAYGYEGGRIIKLNF